MANGVLIPVDMTVDGAVSLEGAVTDVDTLDADGKKRMGGDMVEAGGVGAAGNIDEEIGGLRKRENSAVTHETTWKVMKMATM